MISSDDYFKGHAGHPGITPAMRDSAADFLPKVNALLEWALENGWKPKVNPTTGTLISGVTNGGWRPLDCPEGAPGSSHKKARGVDVSDPDDALDDMLTDEILERFGLYREHPSATKHWCHLTDKAPGSGNRSFYP